METKTTQTLKELTAMKKVELTVRIEPERLDALRFFMKSKEHTTPQKELQRTLESLYEKYVPVETREYLDSKRKSAPTRLRPKRSANATTPMATTIKEENGNG
jgi:nicotinamide riboside kinase